jgi:hypothetical protein
MIPVDDMSLWYRQKSAPSGVRIHLALNVSAVWRESDIKEKYEVILGLNT